MISVACVREEMMAWLCIAALFLQASSKAEYAVQLNYKSSTYVPTGYDDQGGKQYSFTNSSFPFKLAFDKSNSIIYVAGGASIHHYLLSEPSSLIELGMTETEPGFSFVDIRVCGHEVFALSVDEKGMTSLCSIYRKYARGNYSGKLSKSPGFKVAGIAQTLYVSSQCDTLVITIEGRAYVKDELFRDPPPAIVVLHLPKSTGVRRSEDLEQMLLINDFSDLNNRIEELEGIGLRFPMKWRGSEPSRDIDPVDVAVDEESGSIYVTLQTNNAIAELDLKTAALRQVVALGLKNWDSLAMDASDEGRQVSFAKYPIYSYYLPGALKLFRSHHLMTFSSEGEKERVVDDVFLVMADEGSHRDYRNGLNWTEVITGQEIVDSGLVLPSVTSELSADLANTSRLGRLEFTKINGEKAPDVNGFRRFVALGGRGFSIVRARDLRRVYDSGDVMELRHAQVTPRLFNGHVLNPDRRIYSSLDLQSPVKGLQPSVVEIGQDKTLDLLFIGSKHPGSVAVFSVLTDVTKPRFETLWSGIPDDDMFLEWGKAYDQRRLSGVAVTDILFLPRAGHSSQNPLLLVAGSAGSTLTILEVDIRGNVPGYSNAGPGLRWNFLALSAMLMLLAGAVSQRCVVVL